MKNLIALLIAVGLSVLYLAFPENIPANVGEAWSTAEFSIPVSETGYWVLGLSAAAGYGIWWALGLLMRRGAGFTAFVILTLLIGGLCLISGVFRYTDVGLLFGCGLYSLLSEFERPTKEEEAPSS